MEFIEFKKKLREYYIIIGKPLHDVSTYGKKPMKYDELVKKLRKLGKEIGIDNAVIIKGRKVYVV